MSTNNSIYSHCDVCGKEIRYGNAVLEIERNVEQHDYEEDTALHSVTVIDAEPLATLCARCGNSLADRKEIWKHLVRTLGLPGPASDEDVAQQTEAGLPETCGCCGEELKIGRARVSLVQLIGQMDWSDERQDGELFVIHGEDLLSFCPDCGNRMSTHRLKAAMVELLEDVAAPERHEYGTPQTAEYDGERLLYEKKAELLQRALARADEMDEKFESMERRNP